MVTMVNLKKNVVYYSLNTLNVSLFIICLHFNGKPLVWWDVNHKHECFGRVYILQRQTLMM